jgi:hypothetical protein
VRPELRWLLAWGLAYNLLHHLGALPGGLSEAPGSTRWVDWLDLLTPYAVVGPALATLAAAHADRRAWVLALVGALAYTGGHGIHLAANSIGNARGDAAPVHLWDEVVGHWLWYAGVALLVVALARAVTLPARPPTVALALAVATGVTWTTNALEGTTGIASLLIAAALAAHGWRRRDDGAGRLLLLAFGLSALLLAAYGLWQGGFPAPSAL